MKKNKISWSSPSNIAIVKYWGKFGNQLPMNPSLSFTLSDCKTFTSVEWQENKGNHQPTFEFYYDGKQNPAFKEKINKYLESITDEFPFLKDHSLNIHSRNTFPHSAGIASSASAMSALALCLVSMEQELKINKLSETDFFKRASYFSRLGSGSASRSVYPMAALWGNLDEAEDSANEMAIPFSKQLHADFQKVQDCIFIINKNEKSVSSRAGHQLMENHPYRLARIDQANKNILLLMDALKNGDWKQFISVTEEEALSLHGLMMSSNPGYILLEPESINLVNLIVQFRKESGLPMAFTIDAGPNIHLLYPDHIEKEIKEWIQRNIPQYIKDQKLIFDKMGTGPEKIADK